MAKESTLSRKTQKRRTVGTYKYRDETGQVLFEVVRYEPKNFSMRRPGEHGDWIPNIDSVRRVLYRLPEVIAAVQNNETVYVVEGEKDADRLASLGLCATTNPQGAGQWKAEYSESLEAAHVVILPDNDEAGRRHAEKVAQSLQGKAVSIKVLPLPGLPDKGDVSDWLDLDGANDARKIEELAEAAGKWQPGRGVSDQRDKSEFALTDYGNAERLASLFGHHIRYCWAEKCWYVWSGKRWERDDGGGIQRMAQMTVRKIGKEALRCTDETKRQTIFRWAAASEAVYHMRGMLDLARSLPGVPVLRQEFDTNSHTLNTGNGIVDLYTGELKAHNPSEMVTRITNSDFDPTARHPAWDRLLKTVANRDVELEGFLQVAIGCSLVAGNVEEKLFLILGPPATCKTTFLEAIKSALGTYAASASLTAFARRNDPGAARGELVNAQGARLLLSSEADGDIPLVLSLMKAVTGRDTLTLEKKYQDAVELKPSYTWWIASNESPAFPAGDDGIWRRIVCIPFTHVVPEQDRRPELKESLQRNAVARRAILRWCIEGARLYHQNGLVLPESVRTATAELRSERDPLSGFISDCCQLGKGNVTSSTDLLEASKAWAAANGKPAPVWGALASTLKRHKCTTTRGSGGVRLWSGVSLVEGVSIPRAETTRCGT